MELIKKLTACNSPSGREFEIRDLIIEEIKDYCDDIKTDALGNIIATKNGSGKKTVAIAHMDEIGVVVTYKDDKGFLRFSAVGGLSAKNLVGRRVVFQNGAVGVIGIDGNSENMTVPKMYIDLGDSSSVNVGDMACFEGGFVKQGDIIISKALDNRVGCYVLIEALKRIKGNVTFIFSVQEEVGLRGAKAVGFGIEADSAIAVDVTLTGDTPECEAMSVNMGDGVAVKIMDRSVICHSEVRDRLINVAKENGIKYQLEVLTHGGTDAGAIHLSGGGIKTGALSIPCRYVHSPSEMVNVNDLQSAIDLLTKYCME